MPKVIVEVMPKPEILDPQGKAITGALKRLGYEGFAVRQGKRFEITVDGEIDEQRWQQIQTFADTLLANTVIEAYQAYVPAAEAIAEPASETETVEAPDPAPVVAATDVPDPAPEETATAAPEPVQPDVATEGQVA
jgi:phosphoribosylformylglycinamidine synthase PurS subunit